MPDGIEIIIDCQWSSRGFFAEEAIVTVWESQTDTIIDWQISHPEEEGEG